MKSLGIQTLVVVSLLVSACAHSPRQDQGVVSSRTQDRPTTSQESGLSSFRVSDAAGPSVTDKELETIPTEINPLVEKWVAYFQGRGRKLMERYLARSTRYSALMRKILRDNGLPEDLLYIALIESGFSPRATSTASAVGYWQFIRGTGKRFGLEISKFVDERRDPVLATQAAADYFKGLYSQFGSWYLAMASYNVGENRVKKETIRNYTNDFWELARRNKLPKETINYVPKFIAAKLIAQNPEKFGFEGIDYMPPIEFEHIVVDQPVNLRIMAEKMDYPYDEIKALNPKFKGEVAPKKSGKSLELRVPVGMTQVALQAASESYTNKVEFIADSGDTTSYRVKPGDTLHTIARKFRTNVANLRDLNDLPKKKRLRVGMNLLVPDRTNRHVITKKEKSEIKQLLKEESKKLAKIKEQLNDLKNSNQDKSQADTHTVRAGENLSVIARKYKVTISSILKANNLSKRSIIKSGMQLVIPNESKGAGDDSIEKKSSKSVDSGSSGNRKPASKKTVHVVKKGETLLHIAGKYNVSLKDLKKKNKLNSRAHISVGARLFIPEASASR